MSSTSDDTDSGCTSPVCLHDDDHLSSSEFDGGVKQSDPTRRRFLAAPGPRAESGATAFRVCLGGGRCYLRSHRHGRRPNNGAHTPLALKIPNPSGAGEAHCRIGRPAQLHGERVNEPPEFEIIGCRSPFCHQLDHRFPFLGLHLGRDVALRDPPAGLIDRPVRGRIVKHCADLPPLRGRQVGRTEGALEARGGEAGASAALRARSTPRS